MSKTLSFTETLALVMPAGSVRNVSFSVSGGNLTRKHSGNALIDYSGMALSAVFDYADDNRIIALQRPLRPLGDDECAKLLREPIRVHATACGGKITTPAERIAALIASGMPEPLARLAVTDPTKFAELMASMASGK